MAILDSDLVLYVSHLDRLVLKFQNIGGRHGVIYQIVPVDAESSIIQSLQTLGRCVDIVFGISKHR